MKAVCFALMFAVCWLIPNATCSQVELKPELKLKIVDHSGGFLEPLVLRMELICPESVAYEAFPVFNSGIRPQLEYKNEKEASWRVLEGSQLSLRLKYFNEVIPLRQEELNLINYPKGYKYETNLIYPFTEGGDFSDNYLFNSPGVYLVRLKVCPFFADESCLISSVGTLVVQRYNRLDKKAIRCLKKIDTPSFFYEPFLVGSNPVFPDYSAQAIAFLKRYGESSFGHWVRYYIAYRASYQYLHQNRESIQGLVFAQTLLEEILKDSNYKNSILKDSVEELLSDIEVYINTNEYERMREN
jgi:hypothetical protein